MSVLALIPARRGSKGIANKNLRPLAGISPIQRAVACAEAAGCAWVEVSTDYTFPELYAAGVRAPHVSQRPPELCGDDVPMIDVVLHVLNQIPEDSPLDTVLLVQPTQPLREPKHLRAAIELIEQGAESVVSVVELPRTHDMIFHFGIENGRLESIGLVSWEQLAHYQRQDCPPAYIRDGTVYAARRGTIISHKSLYGSGQDVRPLVIPASETCPLDEPEDWANAERRLQARG